MRKDIASKLLCQYRWWRCYSVVSVLMRRDLGWPPAPQLSRTKLQGPNSKHAEDDEANDSSLHRGYLLAYQRLKLNLYFTVPKSSTLSMRASLDWFLSSWSPIFWCLACPATHRQYNFGVLLHEALLRDCVVVHDVEAETFLSTTDKLIVFECIFS